MSKPNWDSFTRVNAGERFRAQSAAMGTPMTEAIVREAQIEQGLRVLDVACGSGEPSISIAALMSGTGHVVGIDLAEAPLEVARGRAKKRELHNVEFRQADVHQLPFESESFDRVVSRLGVMFFADLPRALSELHRVLARGGRISILAWGSMQQPYFDATIGTILRMLPGAAVPDSARAMFKFGEPGKLTAALQAAGFDRVQERVEAVDWNWPGTPEDMWAYFQGVTVPFRPLMEKVQDNSAIQEAVLHGLRECYDGKEVRFKAEAAIASAYKP